MTVFDALSWSASPGIVTPPLPHTPVPSDPTAVYWRIGICDLSGRLISLLSPVATQKQLRFPLDRPSSLIFTVPAFDPHVNILHTDGFPFVSVGNRIVKAWRREAPESEWTLRFAGIVWNIQDVGDANATYTTVTAFDPFHLLTKRMIYSATGTFHDDVVFKAQAGNVIAKALVDRSISNAGNCGIETSGTFTTAPTQSWAWSQQYVATGLGDLCDTGKLDVWFDPVDERTDGIIAIMNASPARGKYSLSIDMDDFRGAWSATQAYVSGDVVNSGGNQYVCILGHTNHVPPNGTYWTLLAAVQARPTLSFAAPGHSAFSLDRSVSMDNFANSIYLYPGDVTHTVVHVSDSASRSAYHTYEDASVLTDIPDPHAVTLLANLQLAMRKQPQDLLTLLPVPGRAFLPWRDYFLGDMVNVRTSIGYDQIFPSSRESLNGAQRIFGITINIDENGVERVSGIDFSIGQVGSL